MGFNLHLIEYLVVSTFLGGLLTLAIIVYRNSPLAVYTGQNLFLRNFANAKGGIPYGIALGIGGLLTYPSSPLMTWALEAGGYSASIIAKPAAISRRIRRAFA